ncbi:hypothetical protein [uncultured Sphingomonas sp.]
MDNLDLAPLSQRVGASIDRHYAETGIRNTGSIGGAIEPRTQAYRQAL